MDYIIVVLYLLTILIFGIKSSKISSTKEFALSNKIYSTFVIMATISASFIGGGFSSGNAAKVYSSGISNIFALMGFSISLFIVGKFLIPRLKSLKGKTSLGQIMISSYGKKAGIICGVFSFLICSTMLGAQVGAMGYIFSVFFNIQTFYGVVISFSIIIIYSSLGGMSAIIKCDTVQFILLFFAMPILLLYSIYYSGGIDNIINNVPSSFFSIVEKGHIIEFISLFLTFALGELLLPPFVQRLLISDNIRKTQKAIKMSSYISALFFIITGLIGLCGYVYFRGSTIDSNGIMPLMIDVILPVGLRGILIAGMLAIIVSSGDSLINSASVSLVVDVIQPILKGRISGDISLFLLRVVNCICGMIGIIIPLIIPDIIDILVFCYNFWAPTIVPSLIFALIGKGYGNFYSSCFIGFLSVVIWSFLREPFGISSVVFGFVSSFIVYIYTYKNRLKTL